MSTSEGYQWTEQSGLRSGIPTEGVVASSTLNANGEYDVIVIGAGYAGLIAARNLATSRLKVLLIEARDRIGGRTWTSVIDGFKYEMGGTWIHWKQPHVYAELSRYGMKDQLTYSPDYSSGINRFSINDNGARRDISHGEEDALFASALTKFFNVDGQMGRKAIPFPHDPFANEEETRRWDSVSLVGRLAQLKGQLTPDEETVIISMSLHMSGGALENTGFFDLLRWWALCDYKPEGINEYGLALKLKCGQTTLAKRILDDGLGTGHLHIQLASKVQSVHDDGQRVTIKAAGDRYFSARKVVSTLPLNVLHETSFLPLLKTAKTEASKQGHVDVASKVHFETPGADLKSWSGMAWPGKGLLYAYGDGVTPKGSTHVVAFGAQNIHLQPEDDIEATKLAIREIREFPVERIVFHNWARDPYAKGAWCVFDTGFATKYSAVLQEDHGNVAFASADWAHGWRGFIDGAIEQGAAVAHRISLSFR